MTDMLVAIDGPAGAGKSTVARAVASALGFTYLDTGAMYRAAALARAAHPGVDLAVVRIAFSGEQVLLDGDDVSTAIRTPETSQAASRLATDPAVRTALVAKQRALIAAGDWVAEGRDIGTVVAPDAEVKVWLTAAAEERARRREIPVADLVERDERDASRDASRDTLPATGGSQRRTAPGLRTAALTLPDMIRSALARPDARRVAAGLLLAVGLCALAAPSGAQASGAAPGTAGPDWFSLALGVVGGLALFLYGVTRLADVLEEAAGEKVKAVLGRFTTNRLAAVGTGAVATAVLDSSSVTIVMVIALVHAGLLTFAQSLGVVMGSNIGTTVSSLLFATDFDRYAPLLLALGLGLHVVPKSSRVRTVGLVVLGVGLVFFGLSVIGDAVEPLRDHPPFVDFMAGVGRNTLLGVAIGALATVVLQSSSATVGIVIVLASQGVVSLPAGIAVMLGAEVGTCVDTLLASVGRSREAVRTGLFHLGFNLGTAAVGIVFAAQLAALGQAFGGGDVERQIAVAQVLFNVAGVALVLPFTGPIARALERLVPAR